MHGGLLSGGLIWIRFEAEEHGGVVCATSTTFDLPAQEVSGGLVVNVVGCAEFAQVDAAFGKLGALLEQRVLIGSRPPSVPRWAWRISSSVTPSRSARRR